MKKVLFTLIPLGAVAALGISSAIARPPAGERGPKGPRCMPPHIKAQLPTYDANKNGILDPEERRAMHEAMRAADLARYDADKDGRLSKTERDTMHRDKMIEHFERLDTNQDAEIAKSEVVDSCSPLERHFDEADSDGNGLVSWAEFEAAAPKRPHHRGPRGAHGPRRGPGPDGECSK